MDGLKCDLDKFREHYTEQAFSFWSEWMNNVNDMATVSETHPCSSVSIKQ